MPVTYLIARVLHIVAGTLWAGASVLLIWFVEPAVRATGAAGGAFMQRLAGPGRLSAYMSTAALITSVTGLFLYWPVSGHLSLTWMATGFGAALTIGSLAGLAAFFVGMLVNAPASNRMGLLGREIQAAGGTPDAGQLAERARLLHRLHLGGTAGAVLLLVATAGMAVAKYLF